MCVKVQIRGNSNILLHLFASFRPLPYLTLFCMESILFPSNYTSWAIYCTRNSIWKKDINLKDNYEIVWTFFLKTIHVLLQKWMSKIKMIWWLNIFLPSMICLICHVYYEMKLCTYVQWKLDITGMVGPEQESCYSRSLLHPKSRETRTD